MKKFHTPTSRPLLRTIVAFGCLLAWIAGNGGFIQAQVQPVADNETTRRISFIRSQVSDSIQAGEIIRRYLSRQQPDRMDTRTAQSAAPAAQVMAAAASPELYVSVDGDDSNSGTSAAAPLRTITKAIQVAPTLPGWDWMSPIRLAPGTYREQLVIRGIPIRLVGNNSDPSSVVIDGGGAGIVIEVRDVAAALGVQSRAASLNAEGLTITGGKARQSAAAVSIRGEEHAPYVFLKECIVTGNTGRHIIECDQSTLCIENLLIHHNIAAESVVLSSGGMSYVDYYHCTATDNLGEVAFDFYDLPQIYFGNAIVYNNLIKLQIRSNGGYSINGYIKGGLAGSSPSSVIDTDPKFVSPKRYMYQLADDSPCIDAGGSTDYNRPPARGTVTGDLGYYGGPVSAQPLQIPAGPELECDNWPECAMDNMEYDFDYDCELVLPMDLGLPRNENWICSIRPQIEVKSIPQVRPRVDYRQEVQYFDGAGMVTKTVQTSASPLGTNIATIQQYDSYNRLVKQSLPYIDENSRTPASFYANPTANIPADSYPWNETGYNDRSTDTYGPGQAWLSAGKSQNITILRSNTANEVLIWEGSTTVPTGYYPAGTLYVTEATDEDGRKTTTYTDLHGRTVRQQQMVSDTENAITDYGYYEWGKLAYVIPPAIVKDANAINITPADFYKYTYCYYYDTRQRETEKYIPGAGLTLTVYNKLDQPVLTQDADQWEHNEWRFTKYDAHGRVAITGLYTSTASRETLQGNVYAAAQWEDRGTAAHGYTNSAFPADASKCEVLTVNYYDDYDFDRDGTQDHPLAGADSRTHGLPTGSKTKALDSQPEQWLATIHFYDAKGRVIRTSGEQSAPDHAKIIDETTFEYDFTGRLLKSERQLRTEN